MHGVEAQRGAEAAGVLRPARSASSAPEGESRRFVAVGVDEVERARAGDVGAVLMRAMMGVMSLPPAKKNSEAGAAARQDLEAAVGGQHGQDVAGADVVELIQFETACRRRRA